MADMPENRSWQELMRYGSSGLELFATFGLLLLIGLWLDRKFGTDPILTLCGAGVGFAAGLYRLIRRAMQLQKPPEPKDRQDDKQ
jgi:ATP synthase protein I